MQLTVLAVADCPNAPVLEDWLAVSDSLGQFCKQGGQGFRVPSAPPGKHQSVIIARTPACH
jgi:hypothetical protein